MFQGLCLSRWKEAFVSLAAVCSLSFGAAGAFNIGQRDLGLWKVDMGLMYREPIRKKNWGFGKIYF